MACRLCTWVNDRIDENNNNNNLPCIIYGKIFILVLCCSITLPERWREGVTTPIFLEILDLAHTFLYKFWLLRPPPSQNSK